MTLNRKKYQLTVKYKTTGREELLTFPHSVAMDAALNNLRRMQTVDWVKKGDKRTILEGIQK
ncbi:hypothetical protein [Micavibrio aeruginosavorus]|uniref:Uncharacterized protein n=1 Tax=Micavibrio aeruginosavorus (strain ARL-13) TaxID=856793 RepID=G2KMX5_MICAA|nr:hypothetical protein [Micavibrio aeruginosavorus]AEP08907.1 hypothetical protein MICA_570 [Micavibrio aeruginosavorus ARL-13]